MLTVRPTSRRQLLVQLRKWNMRKQAHRTQLDTSSPARPDDSSKRSYARTSVPTSIDLPAPFTSDDYLDHLDFSAPLPTFTDTQNHVRPQDTASIDSPGIFGLFEPPIISHPWVPSFEFDLRDKTTEPSPHDPSLDHFIFNFSEDITSATDSNMNVTTRQQASYKAARCRNCCDGSCMRER